MKPTIVLPSEPNQRWELARQMGVECAVSSVPRDVDDPFGFDNMLELKNRFDDSGLELLVLEDRPPMDDVMTDGPKAEEQLEETLRFIENMGRAGIPVWCSAWMARQGWLRTSTALPDRGGSLVSGYDHDDMRKAPDLGDVSEETLWEQLEWFVEQATPVAEEHGVYMAMHPDDPPLSPIRGVGRIMRSVENYERLLDIYDSPHNGITFCQGNFSAMGADVPATIRKFGDRIHFAHFRDVEGRPEKFRETWHTEGQTDMHEAMKAYRDVGFDGPMRPDHVPTMAGEDNSTPGYHTKGRLWAIGYMQGLIESLD
ncbi:MAG: mannonate dehydratase [Halobacteriaceae archaeon]